MGRRRRQQLAHQPEQLHQRLRPLALGRPLEHQALRHVQPPLRAHRIVLLATQHRHPLPEERVDRHPDRLGGEEQRLPGIGVGQPGGARRSAQSELRQPRREAREGIRRFPSASSESSPTSTTSSPTSTSPSGRIPAEPGGPPTTTSRPVHTRSPRPTAK